MKKSVIVLIALIYVASIALVGFLGLKAKTYNEVIYVEKVEILNDYRINSKGEKVIDVYKTEDGRREIQLNCRVIPTDANDTGIVYTVAKEFEEYVIVDENGLVSMHDMSGPLMVRIYVTSHENPTIKEEVKIYFRD